MKPVTAISEALESFDRVKSGARQYQSNFFVPPDASDGWIESQSLFLEQAYGTVFLLKRESGFYRLYFASPSNPDLSEAIGKLAQSVPAILVCELVGRQEDVHELMFVFKRRGFQKRKCLYRMSALSSRLRHGGSRSADPVTFADRSHAEQVELALLGTFDRFAERLPTPTEIRNAIDAQEILVVESEEGLAGLLHFERTGLTSHLRFWWVDDSHRGRGIGSHLMRRYFTHCKGARRFVLWVESGNEQAISAYGNFGFKPDGLTDQVLVLEERNQ